MVPKLVLPVIANLSIMLSVSSNKTDFQKAFHLFYMLMLNLTNAYIKRSQYEKALETLSLCKRIVTKECDECPDFAIGDELRSRTLRDYEEYARLCKSKVVEMRELERVMLIVAHEQFPSIDAEFTQLKMSDKYNRIAPEALTDINSLVNIQLDRIEQHHRIDTIRHPNIATLSSLTGIAAKTVKTDNLTSQLLSQQKVQESADDANPKAASSVTAKSVVLKWLDLGLGQPCLPKRPSGSSLMVSSRSVDRIFSSASGSNFWNIANSPKVIKNHSTKASLKTE